MKKILVLFLALLMLCCLFLSCKKKTVPPELTEVGTNWDNYVIPTEYVQPYMTTGHGSYTLYRDCFYYCSDWCYIQYIQMSDANTDLRTLSKEGTTATYPPIHSVCGDPLCQHNTTSCIAGTGGIDSEFLIDEVESAGQNPIIYCFSGKQINRIDTGAGTRKSLVSGDEPIRQMATYKDSVYFVTQSSDDSYKINMVKKSGGTATCLEFGKVYLNLIGGNQRGLYLNDEKGNVYHVDYELTSSKIIYTAGESYPMIVGSEVAEFGMFVDENYLYFYADYETQTFPWGTKNTIDFIKHSIRRIHLDDLSQGAELVVDDVFEKAVYGIYNGVLYYGPYRVSTDLTNTNDPTYISQFSHSNGTIRGVNLSTLESGDLVSDCGMNFEVGPYIITDKYIIGTIHPYKAGLGIDSASSGMMILMYDFRSGAIYRLCACV